MKQKTILQEQKAITLIALVITIVVMLILAGVTINLTLGQNGIFTTAQKAAQNYTTAQNHEMGFLEGFTNEVNNIIQPEPLGTIIKTNNGINYIADGIGNTIPVPEGFSPITTSDQGTMLTGFVIKNNVDGNEFVWVPVKGMIYTYNRYAMLENQPEFELDEDTQSMKIKYSILSSDYHIEKMPEDERISVATYGGFYIGRYEAGIKDYDKENIADSNDSITNGSEKENWTGYTAETGKNLKLVVQAEQQVWNYITRNKAKTISEALYNKTENNAFSKLCSSYAWDTTLKFMESTGSTYPINSIGGYYGQASVTTTGYDTTHPCNIYDMGGNASEWTTESYTRADASCIGRGGSYLASASDSPAAYRYSHHPETSARDYIAFRVTMYL